VNGREQNGPFEHEIRVLVANGASLKILYFSDREQRLIFSYRYVGEKKPGQQPDIVNDVQLTANYECGILASPLVLSMHVIFPERLGQRYWAGVDISPGAKTYLEFTYERRPAEYRLVEISKGASQRVKLDEHTRLGLIRQVQFPFPVLDRVPLEMDRFRLPFLTNSGEIADFDPPERTLR
jgi:hypothetical protein